MKKINQLTTLIVLAFLSTNTLSAQNVDIMKSYNRPTIANLCLVFGDETEHEEKVRNTFGLLPPNPKFNIASMDFHINAGLSKTDSVAMYDFTQKTNVNNRLRRIVSKKLELYPADDAIGMRIRSYLEEEANIGGDVMAQWGRQENGEFVTIGQRSAQNMTLADYQRKTDAQKLAVYEDMLRNNFVIVYNFSDWRSNKEDNMKNIRFNGSNVSDEQIVATVHAFIYKIEISDEQFGKEIAPNFDNTTKLKSIRYPVKYIGHTKVTEAFVPSQRYSTGNTLKSISSFKLSKSKPLSFNRNDSDKSTKKSADLEETNNVRNVEWETLKHEEKEDFTYQHITERIFDNVIGLVEMSVPEFQVRTELTGTTPFTAPIGLREGVKAGQRYRVYENVYKRSKNLVKTKSKGILVATTKIGDNQESLIDSKTNKPIETEFKQVNGDILRENMYMVQDNDYGLSLSIGTLFGYFGSEFPNVIFHGRGEKNVSNLINKLIGGNKVYGIHTFVGFGFGTNKVNENFRVNLINFDFGISKRLYLHRKFDIIPELSCTIGSPSVTTTETTESVDEGMAFINLGGRFPIWIKENFAIEPAIEIPLKISSNDYENPASFLHFALRGRLDF